MCNKERGGILKVILLPIRPQYVERILKGDKKFEYRKRLSDRDIDKIIIYSTAPVKAVVGEVEVKGTLSMSKTALWEATKAQAGISREKYRRYFAESKKANAYILGKVYRYPENITLDKLGIKYAPQSFVYLKTCPYCGNVLSKDACLHGFSTANSEEHIIPFSLGNSTHVIPSGIICDNCNNYFATNIEKQFLELESIQLLRSLHTIPSRKNKVPPLEILINGEISRFEFDINNNCAYIGLSNDTINKLINSKLKGFITKGIDIETLNNNYVVSRFLLKVFTEICLLYSLKYASKSTKTGLYMFDDSMKQFAQYVRRGDKQKKVYKYTAKQVQEIKPFPNDDFVASIKINFIPNTNQISGMTLTLFEIEFDLLL